jgi:hypothetical protein
MQQPTQTQLVAGQLNGQELTVWLIRPTADRPETVSIAWPSEPTVVTTAHAPATMATACRLLAAASTELSRIKAGGRS